MKAILLVSILSLSSAFADQALLMGVEASGGGESDFLTDLTFDKDISAQALIEYSNEYVQIDLKGQNRLPRREVVRVANPEFQSVILSQFSPDVVRARLMFKEKGMADQFKGRVAVETEGQRIRLRVMSPGAAVAAAEAEESTAEEMPATETSTTTVLEKPATELLAGELKLSEPIKATTPAVVTASTEAEIPVLTKISQQTNKAENTTTRLVISLGIVLLVAGGIVLFSKQWAKRRTGLAQHHQIKVLTQYGLGPKKSLAIIRVAGESILIGVTDTNISMIKSLAMLDEDLPIDVPRDFSNELGQAATVPSLPPAATVALEGKKDPEDFSFGTVRDMVASRLREMRSL